ncbi:MAG: HlyD family efflux transporter periplasmic adaptor subunit [Pirellulaceae bacterium]|nr:HlyD family efflux transporter periplasmic adaptor subunit [Pirellulaceae bacterium]
MTHLGRLLSWFVFVSCFVLRISSFSHAAPPGPQLAAPSSPGNATLTHCLVSLIEDIQVPALEAGALTSLVVTEGQFVTAGQLLARIDDRQPKVDKLAAELERDAALAKAADDIEVRFSEAALQVAVAELQRAVAIDAKSPGGVTQQEIQKLRLAKHRDELQIDRSKLEMRIAKMNADVHQAAVQKSDDALARRQIVSPIDGIVVTVFHERGEWLNAGEPVLQVVRIDRLRVEGFLNASEFSPGEIAGRAVTVEVPLTGGKIGRFAGQIVFVSPLVQAGNKYRVRAEVENRSENGHPILRPGMSATMTVHLVERTR